MDYQQLWDNMVIEPGVMPSLSTVASKLLVYKEKYEEVAKSIGCPWYFIAPIHYRESSIDFKAVLHNGERIVGTGKKTTLVPKGKGPFATWEEAAIDALKGRKIDRITHWTLPVILEEFEMYNGSGYRLYHTSVPSPYVWSGTTYYSKGKYASDGKFDPNLTDKQLGCAPILRMITDKTLGIAK